MEANSSYYIHFISKPSSHSAAVKPALSSPFFTPGCQPPVCTGRPSSICRRWRRPCFSAAAAVGPSASRLNAHSLALSAARSMPAASRSRRRDAESILCTSHASPCRRRRRVPFSAGMVLSVGGGGEDFSCCHWLWCLQRMISSVYLATTALRAIPMVRRPTDVISQTGLARSASFPSFSRSVGRSVGLCA